MSVKCIKLIMKEAKRKKLTLSEREAGAIIREVDSFGHEKAFNDNLTKKREVLEKLFKKDTPLTKTITKEDIIKQVNDAMEKAPDIKPRFTIKKRGSRWDIFDSEELSYAGLKTKSEAIEKRTELMRVLGQYPEVTPKITFKYKNTLFNIFNTKEALQEFKTKLMPKSVTLDSLGLQNIYETLEGYVKSGKPQEGIEHLTELGKSVYAEGKTILQDFTQRMKEHLGKLWDSFKDMIKSVYDNVKAWNEKLGERGAIGKKQMGEGETTTPQVKTKDVKKIIRENTGLIKIEKAIREDEALNAVWKKAEQNARIAYREGKKEEFKKWVEVRKGIIAEIKEKIGKNKIINNLKKIQNRIADSRSIAVEYKKKIEDALEGIDLKSISNKKLSKLNDLADYIERGGDKSLIPQERLNELKRLGKADAKNMTLEDLKSLEENIKLLKKLGGVFIKILKAQTQREIDTAISKTIESTRNLDSAPKETRLREIRKSRDMGRISRSGLLDLYVNTLHTFRVADMIDGFKDYMGENVKLIKDQWLSELEYHDEHARRLDSFIQKRVELLGQRELTEDEYVKLSIHGRYQEGSYDAVNALINFYNLNIPEGTIINEYTDLKKYIPIDDTLLEYIDLIKDTVTEKTDDIAAWYETSTNNIFRRVDNYFSPLFYEKTEVYQPSHLVRMDFEDVDGEGNFVPRKRHAAKGFTIERVSGVTKIPRIDIEGIVSEAISAQEWYLNLEPALINTASIVLSKEYQNHAGNIVSSFWKNQIDIVANKGWMSNVKANPRTRLLKAMRGNINQAVLLFKVSTVVMQPFAVFDAMAYAESRWGMSTAARIGIEFTKSLLSPSYANKIIETSKALKQRQGGEIALEEIINTIEGKNDITNKLKRKGYDLITWADVTTAAGVRNGLLKVLTNEGIENAETETDFLMNLTQGSSNVTLRPHILASGEGARTWFTFQTFFLNRWGILIHDIITSKIVRGDIRGKMIGLIGLGILMLGGMAEKEAREKLNRLFGKEPKEGKEVEWLYDIIFYVPEQVPYFGNIVEGKRKGYGGSDIPIVRSIGGTIKGGVDIVQGKNIGKNILKTGEGVMTLWRGTPGTAQIFDILENTVLREEKRKKTKRKRRR